MTPKQFLAHIRNLIANDELGQALVQLRQFLLDSPKLDEVLQQSGRFARVRKQIRLGVVSHEDANLDTNQIRMSLLDLLTEVETSLQTATLKTEAAQAISILESKNVISQPNVRASGNVHIGDKNTTQNAEKIYNIDHIDNANFS